MELDKLLQLGIIYRSECEWASPVHLVQKKGGGWRITGDFRQLNRQTISDRDSIPLLSYFVGDMEGSTVFSSLDLYKGYHQVEIAPEDQCKTSILRRWATLHFDASPWESLVQPTLFNVSCMKFFRKFLMSFASLTISSSSVGTRRSISDTYNWSLNAYPNTA